MTRSVEFVRDFPAKPNYDWLTITKELKKNPGEWAIVTGGEGVTKTPDAVQGITRYMRSGKSPAMPKGDFEATSRGTTIYARYVGGNTRQMLKDNVARAFGEIG